MAVVEDLVLLRHKTLCRVEGFPLLQMISMIRCLCSEILSLDILKFSH